MLDKQIAVDVPASPIELRLGAPAVADATGPWRMRYDNLVVDIW
jgi:hypothetical protein